jgi:hypothetical protein
MFTFLGLMATEIKFGTKPLEEKVMIVDTAFNRPGMEGISYRAKPTLSVHIRKVSISSRHMPMVDNEYIFNWRMPILMGNS